MATFREPKSSKSRRTIPLTTEAVDALKAHQDRQIFERQRFGEASPANDLSFCGCSRPSYRPLASVKYGSMICGMQPSR